MLNPMTEIEISKIVEKLPNNEEIGNVLVKIFLYY